MIAHPVPGTRSQGRRCRTIASVLLAGLSVVACGQASSPADPCEGVTCSFYGICISDGIAPYCSCERGFHPIDRTCVPNDPDNPCDGVDCNTHGNCRVEAGFPICDCYDGYTRDRSGMLCLEGIVGADADADTESSADADADADADASSEADTDTFPDADVDAMPDTPGDSPTDQPETSTDAADGDTADTGPVCGNGILEPGEECESGEERPCTTPCGSSGVERCAECSWPTACLPPVERCNGLDDDCDTAADNGFECAAGSSEACAGPAGLVGSRACSDLCTWNTCIVVAGPPVRLAWPRARR